MSQHRPDLSRLNSPAFFDVEPDLTLGAPPIRRPRPKGLVASSGTRSGLLGAVRGLLNR